MPPIMLNSSQGLQIFAFRTPGETKPCVFVLPFDAHLYVTDGQHRLEALRRAAESRPDLRSDSVGVTIIEEADIDKVHQDFFDAAQVSGKPLAQALLVEYDGREPLNRMAKDIITESTIFQGRIERIGSVGKNSLMLFTNNQVKQAILQLVVGDWSLYGDALQKQAEEAIIPAASLWARQDSRLLRGVHSYEPPMERGCPASSRNGDDNGYSRLERELPALHRGRVAGSLWHRPRNPGP